MKNTIKENENQNSRHSQRAVLKDSLSDAEFTPGPWQVLEGDRCYHVASMDRTFETACIMFVGGEGSSRANARLIAAAPDLYEALVDLVRQLPTDERLADFNLDRAEAAVALVNGQPANARNGDS